MGTPVPRGRAPGDTTGPARPAAVAVSAVLLVLPLAGLALLLARPELDGRWQHHPSHFWLVLATGAVTAVLAYATGVAATRRGDARVLLVSLAFLAASGFLGLHALATPGVLLAASNPGFALATPVGLTLAAVLAAWSATDVSGERGRRIVRRGRWLLAALVAVMVVWAVFSLAEIPPLSGPEVPERMSGPLIVPALAAVVLYAYAAVRYVLLARRRRSAVPLGMAAAFVLLGEAMVAVAVSRNWHASWWEWHVLMLAAFVLVAVAVRVQWHEERFAGVYLDETLSGTREVSVLFADLQGFTTFSEGHEPGEVAAMLNAYYDVAVPAVVRRHGGDVDRLVGDAVMATFNRRGDQPDHARRAAAAALDLQEETGRVAAAHPGWPRFRVGVNTGPALVGVVGASGGRTHTVIGDTVNVAARLEAAAPPGGVLVGADTAAQLAGARLEPAGALALKGRAATEDAFVLHALDRERPAGA